MWPIYPYLCGPTAHHWVESRVDVIILLQITVKLAGWTHGLQKLELQNARYVVTNVSTSGGDLLLQTCIKIRIISSDGLHDAHFVES